MTNKQIIIDGVDVSECQHINAYNPKNPICQRGVGVGGSPSVCNARCRYADEYRYKQLISFMNGDYCANGCSLKQQLDQLKAKNKKLTTKYNDCHCVVTNYHICFEGALGAIQELVKSEKAKEQVEYYTNIALNYLSMRYDERKKVPNKYKQTLTEIKEIAMGIMDNDLEESSAYYDAKQILQKISECEGNDGL